MKKTLITILALCGPAMAETDLTWNFHTTLYSTQSLSYANGAGFTFTLAVDDSDRYTSVTQDYDIFPEVQLTSIRILAKDNTNSSIPSTLSLIVVDGEGALMGVSSSHTQMTGQLNGLTTTRMISTFLFEGTPVTLSTDATYYAYFVKKSTADALEPDFVLNCSNFSSTVTTTVAMSAYQGKNSYDDACDHWGFLSNSIMNTTKENYVPNMVVTVKPIPEPATATLSLLALAALCSRRRR